MAEQLAMPLLIINMGGEMLYILEQRLQAQSIVEEKSLRVLQDVISTMFSDKFLGELFKPQKIYSNSSTRQIFDKLAHSSIMRLNQSSMDKLYDLMTMGCKYQFLTCSHPSELVQISLNHLDALRKLVTSSSEVSKLVESATNTLLSIYKDLRPGEFSLLRQTLCRFFQDRRVKVSLFLQDGIQSPDGSIIMSHRGVLPRGADIPGTIRYYNDDGKVSRTEVIKVPNAEGVQPANNDYTDLTKVPRPCELGLNLYAKDRRKKAAGGMATVPLKKALGGKGDAPENDETSRAAAKAELNLLASMLGGGKPTTEKDNINIVNLFPDTQLGGTDEKTGEKTAELIVFDAADAATLAHQLANSLDIGDSGASEDADLLDLMDGQ